jgi:hypothetical protein
MRFSIPTTLIPVHRDSSVQARRLRRVTADIILVVGPPTQARFTGLLRWLEPLSASSTDCRSLQQLPQNPKKPEKHARQLESVHSGASYLKKYP